ncbi:MAG: hypothetical protein WCS92_04120 [Candidatus Babeliales bacterium]|jgi:hypothetical protein
MKKLFLNFLIFTTTVFTIQFVKPMGQIEPPKTLFIAPNFQCSLNFKAQQANVVQLEYQIDNPNKKLSPLSPANSFDITFVTLTFSLFNNSIDATCLLKNISISGEKATTSLSQILLNSGILGIDAFMAQEFNRPKMIKHLIEIALSIYFREHVISSPNCVLCLKKINYQKSIMLLKCGSTVHKKCYKKHAAEIICTTCNNVMTEDFWYKLKALPK